MALPRGNLKDNGERAGAFARLCDDDDDDDSGSALPLVKTPLQLVWGETGHFLLSFFFSSPLLHSVGLHDWLI